MECAECLDFFSSCIVNTEMIRPSIAVEGIVLLEVLSFIGNVKLRS